MKQREVEAATDIPIRCTLPFIITPSTLIIHYVLFHRIHFQQILQPLPQCPYNMHHLHITLNLLDTTWTFRTCHMRTFRTCHMRQGYMFMNVIGYEFYHAKTLVTVKNFILLILPNLTTGSS